MLLNNIGIFGQDIVNYDGPDPRTIYDINNPFYNGSIINLESGCPILPTTDPSILPDGYKVIINHQRLDFALLSLDQIINNAAKIHYMFGGQINCPLVVRMIIGRGWGQGPTHSQNLQQLFAGIPGLKVVIPGTPQDAYSQLCASINCTDPVIFLEHRWLHNMSGKVDFKFTEDLNSFAGSWSPSENSYDKYPWDGYKR